LHFVPRNAARALHIDRETSSPEGIQEPQEENMRLGNLGLMFGAVLLAGAVGCRHGNEDRGTTASRSDQGYPQGNTSTGQSSGYDATGGTGGHERHGSTDNYGTKDQTGNESRSGSEAAHPQGNAGTGSANDTSGSNPSGMGSNQVTGDAVVNFTTKTSNQNLTGMAAFTSLSSGIKLVVDVNNATPGRYNIILRQDGACDMSGANFGTRGQTSGSSGNEESTSGYGSDDASKSDTSGNMSGDTSGSSGEDQSSSGYRSGSKSAMQKRINLGQFTVDSSGHGHFEQTILQRQLNYQSVGSLENQALVLRQRSESMTSDVGSRGQAAACGIITLSANRPPAS
jgi:hypothetical protein